MEKTSQPIQKLPGWTADSAAPSRRLERMAARWNFMDFIISGIDRESLHDPLSPRDPGVFFNLTPGVGGKPGAELCVRQ